MTSVTIFGDGNMGTAIADLLSAGGATVDHITTSSEDAAVTGDIVVLAVPYPALASITKTYGDQLAGKVVVDITNPIDFSTFDSLTVPADGSSAAELAAALPAASVVKAFNTNLASTLATNTVAGAVPTTVLIAGNDADAKAVLGAAVAAGGLSSIDVGGLNRARELEAIGFLQVSLAIQEKVSWTGGFAVIS